jgi:hypothetical protein
MLVNGTSIAIDFRLERDRHFLLQRQQAEGASALRKKGKRRERKPWRPVGIVIVFRQLTQNTLQGCRLSLSAESSASFTCSFTHHYFQD